MLEAVGLALAFVGVVIHELSGAAARQRARVYAWTYRRVTGRAPEVNPYEES